MQHFTPLSALLGGILIGLGASLLMWLNGRIAGISGIVGQLVTGTGRTELVWRLAFVIGLVGSGWLYSLFEPVQFPRPAFTSLTTLILGGALVGFGTALGSGCTSGHGVCGLSRFSIRSLVATITFIGFGCLTVFLIRHAIGAQG